MSESEGGGLEKKCFLALEVFSSRCVFLFSFFVSFFVFRGDIHHKKQLLQLFKNRRRLSFGSPCLGINASARAKKKKRCVNKKKVRSATFTFRR